MDNQQKPTDAFHALLDMSSAGQTALLSGMIAAFGVVIGLMTMTVSVNGDAKPEAPKP